MKSALVLVGGQGRRLGYKEKALITIKGRTILEHSLAILDGVVDEIIISLRDDEQLDLLKPFTTGRLVVTDCLTSVGPLAGIQEGLKAVRGDYVFIAAGDMPYLNGKVAELLFDRAAGHDAAIPVWRNEILEPLHAVYRSGPMVIETEKAIRAGDRSVHVPISKLKDAVFVEMDAIRAVDPGLRTFININTVEDVEQIQEG